MLRPNPPEASFRPTFQIGLTKTRGDNARLCKEHRAQVAPKARTLGKTMAKAKTMATLASSMGKESSTSHSFQMQRATSFPQPLRSRSHHLGCGSPAMDPAKLKEFFALLGKRHDQLTPDIQAKMQELKVEEGGAEAYAQCSRSSWGCQTGASS